MGKYRGRLTRSRPYDGIQAVLYTPENKKVDVTVTNSEGYYEFSGVPEGNYEVRFYGRGYESDEDFISITIVDNFGFIENAFLSIDPISPPNENNWFKEKIEWNLNFDEDLYTAQFKLWRVTETEPSEWLDWEGLTQTINTQGR